LRSQPIVGLWPAAAVEPLEALLHDAPPHSVYRFAETIGARLVDIDRPPANVNTPADLAALRTGPR
jgi:molybdopterin-guanine dinucleotide biosynthesis protein A